MNGISQTRTPQKNASVSPFFLLFIAVLGTFAVFCYYKPTTIRYSAFIRTWGFDHLTFYSPLSQIILWIVVAFTVLPYSNCLIVNFLSWFSDKFSKLKKLKYPLFIVVSILSMFIFYLLRVKYFFLGDFNLRMEQVMRKDFLANEYLTMKLLYYFAALGQKFGYTYQAMFKLYSIICGGLYVFIACLLGDLLGKNSLQKTLLFFTQICTALLLVFCGYIEIYATPIVFLSLYMYFGLRYLQNNKQFYLVVISLALAISSHLLCLAAVPSLLVVWYFNNKTKVAFVSKMSNRKLAFLITALILITLTVILKKGNSFVLPLAPPPQFRNYLTFFSFRHFWEIINGQLLACGISFILAFVLLTYTIRNKIKLPGSLYFLLSLTGCIVLIVLISNLHRGSGDWDIMAITATSLNFFTALLIIILFKNDTIIQNYLLTCCIVINAINTGLWIHINHTDKSIQKIEKMLVTDPGTYYSSKITGIVQVSVLYKLNKLWEDMERIGLIACNNADRNDVRTCVLYAKNLTLRGKSEQARVVFEDVLTRTNISPEAYVFLLDYHGKKKDEAKIIYYLNQLFDAFLIQPDTFLNNQNVKPGIYLRLFGLLYKNELKNNDPKRLSSILITIQRLENMNLQSK